MPEFQILHTSDCAVHNEPAYPAAPCNCGAQLRAALEAARLALCASNNCLTTDRPDIVNIPADLSWTINNDREIALIDEALAALGVNGGSDPECADRNTAPSTRRS